MIRHKIHQIIIYKMLGILLTIILLCVVTIVYKLWIKPLKILNKYEKILKDKGYKVYRGSYNPFHNHLFKVIKQGINQGDAMNFYKSMGAGQYDVILSNFLNKPKIEFVHPDFVKQYFSVDRHYDYPKDKKIVNIFSRAGGHGLPFSQGQNWKRKRNILNKVFNFDFIKSQCQNIAKICDTAIQQIQNGKIKQNIVQYNILDLTVQMFGQVMMTGFLGGTNQQMIMKQPAGKFLKKLIGDLTIQSFVPLNFFLGTKFLTLGITKQQRQIQERVQNYRQWGYQFIRKRIKQINQQIEQNVPKKQPSDIIQALLIQQRNAKKLGTGQQTMSKQQQIFQQFNAFFIAGTDTTSNFTQMLIYFIAKYPNVQAKIRQQINQFMKNDDYSYENLKNLKYIDFVQKETTRLYGPGTHLFSRQAKCDNYLNGVPIKKGTSINIFTFSNHFSQKYFKNPNQFRPQRWQVECDNLPPFVFGGFSAGARTCIGKHLAFIESKIALVKFMKRYSKITLPNNNFKMSFKFVYCPEDFQSKMEISQNSKL